MKDRNKIIAASIMTLFGLLSGFATLLSMPDELSYLKTIFIIVGIVLIILAAFFFTSYYIDFSNAFAILKVVKKLGIKRIKENEIKNIIWSAWTQKLHDNPQTSKLAQRDFRQRLFEEMLDELSKEKLRHRSRNEIERFANELLQGVDKGYSNQIF